jgi:hypothetical protein
MKLVKSKISQDFVDTFGWEDEGQLALPVPSYISSHVSLDLTFDLVNIISRSVNIVKIPILLQLKEDIDET